MVVVSSRLVFDIAFHTPFRVGTGSASNGLDDSVNRNNPLPGSSLKGLMRAASRDVLAAPDDLINSVFGTERLESPWAWTDAVLESAKVQVQARIKIDEATGTVEKDFLFIAEQIESQGAHFEVVQRSRLGAPELLRHEALLNLAAVAVRQIGADRRRGLGWVTISPSAGPADITRLLTLVRGGTHA